MLSTFYQRYQFTLQKSRTALSLIPSRADIRVPLDRSRLRRKGDGEKRKVYSYAVRNAIHDDPPIFLKEGKYSDSLYKAGKHFLHRIGTFKHDLFSDRITVFNRSSVLKRYAFHILLQIHFFYVGPGTQMENFKGICRHLIQKLSFCHLFFQYTF